MSLSILVVDDHHQYLAMVRSMLEVYIPEALISAADTGSAALSLVKQQAFNLLIVDYQLQTTTGTDLVRQLRARSAGAGRPLPPVVMMSSQPDAALFAQTIGVEAFLPKPLLGEHISDTLIPLLRRSGTALSARRPLLWSIRRA